LISRYRDELRHEAAKYVALQKAISGHGGAIVRRSMTTVLGVLSLGLAYSASYERCAVPFSSSIFGMAMAAFTLLSALLAILGRFAFIAFIHRTEEMIEKLQKKKNKTFRRPKPSHRIGKQIWWDCHRKTMDDYHSECSYTWRVGLLCSKNAIYLWIAGLFPR